MRLLMPWKDRPNTGKGLFMQRLAQAFPRVGVNPVHDPKKPHDAYLDYNSFKFKSNSPKFLRLNGVYIDKAKPYKKLNKQIQKEVEKATGVIYQSEFCRDMHEKYVGLLKPYKVIYNGAWKFWGAPCYKMPNKNIFVALARWRRHKRLKEIRDAFKDAAIPNSELVIFNKEFDRSKISYTLKAAKALIYLSWLDWCPNSVVEALACGCPVICSNQGGTKELIKKDCGAVLNLDLPFDGKPVDLYNPPKIDVSKVSVAMWDSLNWNRVSERHHIDIINIATQYKDFINDMCGIRAWQKP